MAKILKSKRDSPERCDIPHSQASLFRPSLDVRDNHLLVKGIAYATVDKTVAVGTLVIALHLTADVAQTAPDHTAWFAGQVPCDSFGQPLNKIINSSSRMERAPGLWVDHYFSSKPKSGLYSGYYEQVSTYAKMLLVHAQAIDPRATATPGAISVVDQSQSVFAYEDSASPRAGLSVPTAKLRGQRIAIVGLGGTGAHLLDLICKTPVTCLDLFDGDRIEQHNAFRYPGAVPFSVLKEAPTRSTIWLGSTAKSIRASKLMRSWSPRSMSERC
ncbi:hypothetical protein N8D55_06675 [Xanthomonas hortorum pv. pelargonii]|nr:hypothetical protein N8D55_06675 [Xanthomonas hortorum pv. pelargonii]